MSTFEKLYLSFMFVGLYILNFYLFPESRFNKNTHIGLPMCYLIPHLVVRSFWIAFRRSGTKK